MLPWMASGPGALNLQAHLESQLRFIRGNLARLDRSASNRCLTADESQELSFCERMLGAVRPFKTADIDLRNARLFWEVHDLLLAVGDKRARGAGDERARGAGDERARGAGDERARGARGARGAARALAAPRSTEAGAEDDHKTDRVLNARFQIMGPCQAW
jgi:hypothetical protein